MNEQLIVRSSEIILGLMALLGIVTVIMASWHDFRVIAKRKKRHTSYHTSPTAVEDTSATTSIRTLPTIFARLSWEMIVKALFWHSDDSSRYGSRNFLLVRSYRSMILASICLLVFIGMLTYFFYTAATLRSNTLLTLSWVGVSLWLAAIVWSTEHITLSRKIELTFTVPFMYFIFYVSSFPTLGRYMVQLVARGGQLYTTSLRQLSKAIQFELYSTRF